MDFDFFSSLGFILGLWVLLSPGWRLARLSSQEGPLSEPLVEHGSRVDFTKWLPSWFAFSVGAPLFWIWFFSAASQSSRLEDTFIWSDESPYMSATVILSVVINLLWLLWLCLLNYRKTLMCVGGASLAFSSLAIVALILPSLVSRIYFLGCLSIGLTVISNICRIMSVGNPQFSIFASSVALAGSVAGICWILKALLVDSWAIADGDQVIGFGAVFVKKNFFWKVSSVVGSAIRTRDVVCLIIIGGGPAIVLQEIRQSCLPILQKVTSLFSGANA